MQPATAVQGYFLGLPTSYVETREISEPPANIQWRLPNVKFAESGWISSLPDASGIQVLRERLTLVIHKNEQAPTSRQEELRNVVASYAHLEEDWDGYGGQRPSESSISAALTFIEKLPAGVATPEPMVSGDGSLGFYWSGNNAYIDLDISTAGNASIFIKWRDGSRPSYFEDNIDLLGLSPDWFRQRITQAEQIVPSQIAATP